MKQIAAAVGIVLALLGGVRAVTGPEEVHEPVRVTQVHRHRPRHTTALAT